MNFCKKITGKYICTARNQRHCEHSLLAQWEVFCQWCTGDDECGIGDIIIIERLADQFRPQPKQPGAVRCYGKRKRKFNYQVEICDEKK